MTAQRWMVEITYNNSEPTTPVAFDELSELHAIVELGPDWNMVEAITITLNRPSLRPQRLVDVVSPNR
jgi:hypothetical protein